ncbi:transcriptional regulator, TetR family [Syntrophobotulus glycolicus DSM 8271]|uniref:Transcriptional regulator, TetR family n=1 Tax=Syntrophobotulus glycolicus (strain DSM 8271 / FlGlyR) TaxID=645991 RepID=F0SXN7_SYNGF|nr:TetR/AcrR family transcriptional regulator [Syntrophobotulus glycolicus]ADY55870.1 transcriptional regulator, TetR family [Syntrophobotulus glycolicus DSM 8271]
MSGNLKERILNKALELFNTYGYESVKMRDISSSLNISPGNLTYHFKKKDDIIYAIIQQQCKDHQSRQFSLEDISFDKINNLLKANVEHQRKYFFYFNNIIDLPRKYPEIEKIQLEVKKEFYNLIRDLFQNFISKGWMKAEPYEGVYDDLAFAVLSIIVFWTQETFRQNDFVSRPKDLLSVVWNIILPNLTDEGAQMIPIHIV